MEAQTLLTSTIGNIRSFFPFWADQGIVLWFRRLDKTTQRHQAVPSVANCGKCDRASNTDLATVFSIIPSTRGKAWNPSQKEGTWTLKLQDQKNDPKESTHTIDLVRSSPKNNSVLLPIISIINIIIISIASLTITIVVISAHDGKSTIWSESWSASATGMRSICSWCWWHCQHAFRSLHVALSLSLGCR